MNEVIQQYGRSLLSLISLMLLLALLFSGKNSVYSMISEGLSYEPKILTDKSDSLAQKAFMEKSSVFYPKTNLQANKSYDINSLIEPAPEEYHEPKGGKALRVIRLYSSPKGETQFLDLTSECIRSTGKKVIFPERGLYLLTVSLRDDGKRNALQYLYIFIEGELGL